MIYKIQAWVARMRQLDRKLAHDTWFGDYCSGCFGPRPCQCWDLRNNAAPRETKKIARRRKKAVQAAESFFDSLSKEEKGRYIATMLALNPNLLNSEFLNDPDIAK